MSYYRPAKITGEEVIEEPAQKPEAPVGDSFQVYDEETRGSYISGADALDLPVEDSIGEAE